MTGFILDREIVPLLQLRPGAGYAVVTFTRWVIVIVGAILTLAALGVDPAKVTLVAGALSVGIGFGLQNVVNNFVSGLILIVERPVGVGDLIEVGPLTGEVKRIGIRSSTVRTGQGAEVIVPNSELVSKEVVNWTRSDRQRRYDIDVGVAYGSEPEHVMRLLVEAAARGAGDHEVAGAERNVPRLRRQLARLPAARVGAYGRRGIAGAERAADRHPAQTRPGRNRDSVPAARPARLFRGRWRASG